MQTGIYVGISAHMALERRMNTLADNIANATTTGFRATEVKFNQVVADTQTADVSFVSQGKEYISTRNGGMKHTGNMLDFAVKGDAWFSIETPSGQALTRDGRFTLTEAGDLVTINGYPVLDAGGAPIQLNGATGAPTASSDGVLYQNGQQVGAIGLFEADMSKGFTRVSNSGVIPALPAQPVVDRIDAGLVQGYTEESNVNPIAEMTQLITVTRAFESLNSLMRDGESSFNEAIKTLGGAK